MTRFPFGTEERDYLKLIVLEQMRVPDWPHYPMNDLRQMTLPRYHRHLTSSYHIFQCQRLGNPSLPLTGRPIPTILGTRKIVLDHSRYCRL